MNKPKLKTTKKAPKAVNPAKRAVKKEKVKDEELEETPLLELEGTSDTEDHEILKILDKKAAKPKHTSSVDYIPELERGEFDINE
jgi:hypothetical protein